MISHKFNCIFIHIPKCAGTSIESALGHFDGHEGRRGQDHRSIRMIEQPGIRFSTFMNKENIKDFIRRERERFRTQANPNNALTLSKQQYQDYFKFTLVRNPWARAHSWYKNAIRDEVHQKNYGIDPSISFSEFMVKFAGQGFLRPQTYWLQDFNGNIPMDFVGKFESLEQDFGLACEKMNLPQLSLPHKIAGEKSDYRKHYDDQTAEFVGKFYKKEIELFNYSFD